MILNVDTPVDESLRCSYHVFGATVHNLIANEFLSAVKGKFSTWLLQHLLDFNMTVNLHVDQTAHTNLITVLYLHSSGKICKERKKKPCRFLF